MSDIVYLTAERIREIEAEVRLMKTKGRKEIALKIADARSHGDLSENAEYEAAKHEQELFEIKIAGLENTLSHAQVIKPEEMPNDRVYILSRVKLKNQKTGAILDYYLVSHAEADYERKMLSVTSPLGKALLGKKIGETAEIHAPAGITIYEVLDITR